MIFLLGWRAIFYDIKVFIPGRYLYRLEAQKGLRTRILKPFFAPPHQILIVYGLSRAIPGLWKTPGKS